MEKAPTTIPTEMKRSVRPSYLRKPNDDERLRIYDKRLEQAEKLGISKRYIENWIRTELELRKEKAHYFIQEWLHSEIMIETGFE